MEYTYINPDEEQYDSSSFVKGQPIKARYREAENIYDRGNPFIEALPFPRENKQIITAYTKVIPELKEEGPQDLFGMLSKITLIRRLRFPLPFHRELEYECYMALLSSYRNRKIYKDDKAKVKVVVQNEAQSTHQILSGDTGSGTNAGFHVLGFSGCGKSSALEILFSNYPQYIVHEGLNHTRVPQITYLIVSCQPNSNFKALYAAVGRAIDRALGNINPVYEKEINKAVTLGAKLNLIERYIEIFSIGIIVFDEIQLIDFQSTRENSFESLMTLANTTKVAIAVVGTEDAYGRMFSKLRTSRRLGNEINASAYCEDFEYFWVLAAKLFSLPLFKGKAVQLTEPMAKKLFLLSAGIVDQLIGIYTYVVYDFLKSKKEVEVNEEFIQKTVEKHFPGIQKVLSNLDSPTNDVKRIELTVNAQAELMRLIQDEKQAAFRDQIIEDMDQAMYAEEQLGKIVDAIQLVTDKYNESTIRKVGERVLNLKGSDKKSLKELIRDVLSRLEKKPSDKRTRKTSSTSLDKKHEAMLNFLES